MKASGGRVGLVTIGWREWLRLPELGDVAVKAKMDTGARTSTLHAFGLNLVERDGGLWAEFELSPVQRRRSPSVFVSSPVKELRRVKSSNGAVEERPVISTPIDVGSGPFHIDVTLTNRDEMGFRMLLGRTALRRRFIVDPGRSFLLLRPGPTG
jgi:hypothetical protein